MLQANASTGRPLGSALPMMILCWSIANIRATFVSQFHFAVLGAHYSIKAWKLTSEILRFQSN